MTPDQDDHVEKVRALVSGPLAADAPSSTLRNPAWFFANGRPTPERATLHGQLTAQVWGAWEAPANASVRTPRAVILAGPPGAGKSTVSRRALDKDVGTYLRVDADEFKELLLRQALRDGTYESFIKPDAGVGRVTSDG